MSVGMSKNLVIFLFLFLIALTKAKLKHEVNDQRVFKQILAAASIFKPKCLAVVNQFVGDFSDQSEIALSIHNKNDDKNRNDRLLTALQMCRMWLLDETTAIWLVEESKKIAMKSNGFHIMVHLTTPMESTSASQLAQMYPHVIFIVDWGESKPLELWTRSTTKKPFQLTAVGEIGFQAMTSLVERGRRFDGEPLVASAFHFEPYTIFDENEKAVAGIEFKIAEDIARGLNLSLEVRPPLDGQLWGIESPPGSGNFSGLLGELGFGKVDIGWAHLFVQADRTRAMDFSQWYNLEMTCAAVPKTQPYVRLSLLPFDLVTGLLLVAMVAAVMGLLLLHSLLFHTKCCIGSFVTALLCSVSHPQMKMLTHNHLRIGIIFVLLTTIVLANGYGGSLVSMLTSQGQKPPIDTVDEIVKAHREGTLIEVFNCCTRLDQFLKSSDGDTFNYLSKIVKTVETMDVYETKLKKLNEQGESAFFLTDQLLDYMIRRDLTNEEGITNVHVTKECFLPAQIALGLKKRSFIRNRVDDIIMALKEAGLINEYTKNAMDSVAQLEEEDPFSEEAEHLTMSELQGPLILMTLGMLASALVLLTEYLRAKIKREHLKLMLRPKPSLKILLEVFSTKVMPE